MAQVVVDLPHVQKGDAFVLQGLPEDGVRRLRFVFVVIEIVGELILEVNALLREAHEVEAAAAVLNVLVQF